MDEETETVENGVTVLKASEPQHFVFWDPPLRVFCARTSMNEMRDCVTHSWIPSPRIYRVSVRGWQHWEGRCPWGAGGIGEGQFTDPEGSGLWGHQVPHTAGAPGEVGMSTPTERALVNSF